MRQAQRELVAFLIDTQALRFGEFTLKSGEKSPFFIDLGSIRTGKDMAFLGERLAAAVCEHFPEATLLFGPAYKGIALATTTAVALWRVHQKSLAVCFNRKEEKAHGEGGLFIGQVPTAHDKVVIIDDVLSSGGTKIEAAQSITRKSGSRPSGVVVTVDRTRCSSDFDRAALPVYALATLRDIADYLDDRADPRADLVRRFWEGDNAGGSKTT